MARARRPERRLSALGEFGFLKKLVPGLYWPASLASRLHVAPGDDAGAFKVAPGHVLVATTDAMIEGRHFERAWFPWSDLGYKALAVNLSDLAAMGAVRPVAALITAGFPGDTLVKSVDHFYRGLEACAKQWNIGLLGGDTVGSRADWMVSITVLGEARPQQLIRRSGAHPGDYVITSGPLGLAAAGLEVLQTKRRHLSWTAPLVRAFSRPTPRLALGQTLGVRRWATSLMDCSDGLEASARILSDASSVGIELDLRRLPVSKALSRWAETRKKTAWSYALRGGEDYELIFTVSAAQWAKIHRSAPGATVVGRVLPAGQGLWALTPEGERLALKGYGFAHFGA
jgi:thiamine-monophosphate kinase